MDRNPAGDQTPNAPPESARASLGKRAAVISAGTFASRLLGLFRDMALAALFHRSETDAFFVAFTIPNALRQLFAEGAISSAVVPILSGKIATEGQDAARAFFARVRGVSLIALTLVTIGGVLFARQLCDLFATGYRADPEQFERTVMLTRIVFPYIFFMGTAALGMAALNANRRFFVGAFAPGLLNVAFLICVFALPPILVHYDIDRVYAIGVGALLGGALQVIAQWPALRRIGYLSRPIFFSGDGALRELYRRILPLTFGLGVYYIDVILSRRFLSELGTGAQSYFTWAFRICDFPQGIFIFALSAAALPSLSALAAVHDHAEVRKTFAYGLKIALFVTIPASIAMIAIGEPVVALLFQRGEFDAEASHQTARALMWQGGAIWTVAVVRQTVPVFFALGDTRTPVVTSAIDLLVFIAIALAFRGSWGHVAISAAVAMSSAAQMVMLIATLQLRLRGLELVDIGKSAARTAAASALGGLAGWSGAHFVPWNTGAFGRTAAGITAMVAFCVIFVIAAAAMKSPELALLSAAIRRRLRPISRVHP